MTFSASNEPQTRTSGGQRPILRVQLSSSTVGGSILYSQDDQLVWCLIPSPYGDIGLAVRYPAEITSIAALPAAGVYVDIEPMEGSGPTMYRIIADSLPTGIVL